MAKRPFLLVGLLAFVCFLPFIGIVHLFDWDEINFAESAREMIVSNDFSRVQVNFIPFWEKPPLFFWLQTISMKIFGINEFAARFPNVICGVLTLLLIFHIGRKHLSQRFAWLWVLAVLGSFTPHFYFKTGIIDPFFNLFIFSSWYFMFLYFKYHQPKFLYVAGLLTGLAIITKGPVALAVQILCLCVLFVFFRKKIKITFSHWAAYILIAFCISCIWFGYETIRNGPSFLIEFTLYQIELFSQPVATHGQPFYYHPVVLLLGCFPSSIFALPYLIGKKRGSSNIGLSWFMRTLFWVVLILFSLVTTKIVHYSSLCYLPLTFLAAQYIDSFIENKTPFNIWLRLLFLILGSILSIAFLCITFIGPLKKYIIPLIDDSFAVYCLETPVTWYGYEWLIPLFLILILSYFICAKKTRLQPFVFLFVGIALFLNLYLKFVIPKIEQYVQGPAITFLKKMSDKDVYLLSYGYKSYATAFYGKVKPQADKRIFTENYVINHPTNKPTYLLVKRNHWEQHPLPNFTLLYCEGGFCFVKKLEEGVKSELH